jgi:hypothetical protein
MPHDNSLFFSKGVYEAYYIPCQYKVVILIDCLWTVSLTITALVRGYRVKSSFRKR